MYLGGGDDGGEGGWPGLEGAEPADWRKPPPPLLRPRPEDLAKVRAEVFLEVPGIWKESIKTNLKGCAVSAR